MKRLRHLTILMIAWSHSAVADTAWTHSAETGEDATSATYYLYQAHDG